MFVAIAVMMIISAVAVLVTSLSGKIAKETTDQYRREQAIIYAKSYTELGIMAATANDCIKTIRSYEGNNTASVRQGMGYRIRVRIRHIGDDITTCTNNNNIGNVALNHIPSRGSIVLIDVRVMYRDLGLVDTILSNGGSITNSIPWRTYRKRTVQRL